MVNQETKAKLNKAQDLQKQIDQLNKEIDDLLVPIVKETVKDNDIPAMQELLEELPPGFHKTELRVIIWNIVGNESRYTE
jgi:glucan phosphorylase